VARSIFLAGATGAIVRPLVRMLVEAGHRVTGTTRLAEKAEALRRAGAKAAIVDVFDAMALRSAVEDSDPEIVIHQLTDLAQYLDPAKRAEALERNARIRIEGTANLVAAALMAGARRLIAQSISFAYAPGREPYRESDPLFLDAPGTRAVSVRGVAALEREVTQTPGIEGIVLRYGWLYGPGTGADKPFERGSVHVDAAAHAALLAIERGHPGIYNVAEDDGAVSIEKARSAFGFDPAFRSRSATP
jgi:nucleoside-diphosphate-sugar epimerase